MSNEVITAVIQPPPGLSVTVQPPRSVNSVVNVGKAGKDGNIGGLPNSFDGLPPSRVLTGAETFPISQEGIVVRATLAQLLALVGPAPEPTPMARALAGERVWVRGWAIDGKPDGSTLGMINSYKIGGWPEWAIVWDCLGETLVGSCPLPAVSVAPLVTPATSLTGGSSCVFSIPATLSVCPVLYGGSLEGVSVGVATLAATGTTPALAPVSLSGVQQGAVTGAVPVTVQPQLAVSGLAASIPGTGSFSSAYTTVPPLVAIALLTGNQQGSVTAPALTLRPVNAVVTCTGVQAGSFVAPAVTLQPSNAAVTFNGVQAGSFAAAATTVSVTTAKPTLTTTGAPAGFTQPQLALTPVITGVTLAAAAPTGGSFTEDWESGSLTTNGWTVRADADDLVSSTVTVTSSVAHSGIRSAVCYVSNDDSYNAYATISKTFASTNEGTGSLWVSINGNGTWVVLVNGSATGTLGTTEVVGGKTWRKITFPVPTGSGTTLEVGAVTGGGNLTVYVDDISIQPNGAFTEDWESGSYLTNGWVSDEGSYELTTSSTMVKTDATKARSGSRYMELSISTDEFGGGAVSVTRTMVTAAGTATVWVEGGVPQLPVYVNGVPVTLSYDLTETKGSFIWHRGSFAVPAGAATAISFASSLDGSGYNVIRIDTISIPIPG